MSRAAPADNAGEMGTVTDENKALLEELKEEIRNTIESQTNADERCVLLYRYIQHMKLEEIGYELNISISTVKRWYKSALSKIKVPE